MMQQTRAVEIGVGFFILLGLAAVIFLFTQTTNMQIFGSNDGYQVNARFENVGNLKVRAPVTISGVKIGHVVSIRFDPERLDAVVTININSNYNTVPSDSDASIMTAGLLGGQYVSLQPGGAETVLTDRDEIEFTQSAIILENLIGKYLMNQKAKDQ